MRAHTPRTFLLLAAALLVAVVIPGGPRAAAVQAPEATVTPVPEPGEPAADGDQEPAVEGTGVPLVAESAEGAEEGAAAEPPRADLAADLYLSRCAGCHTIGEGALSGPDLAPSTGWPAADLTKAVERMEKNVGPMTAEQVAALVELLKDSAVKPRLSAARERQVAEMAATLEPASPAIGEALFHGGRALVHGGVACSACHRAGSPGHSRGGTLAADLTDAATRLGEQALIAAAESPGFPLMRATYGSRPVTRQEAVHLAAYLKEVDEQTPDSRAAAPPPPVPLAARIGLWGSAAAALFLAAMVLLYRGRNRGVRARLVRQAHRR